ncbi:oligosaccharide flippase family protein [Zwartia sp.]|uniref:oligosaccharide flippase family protein n=1 Tax=Zwartia sp. TaxID=2978004 RepID=UPI002716B597|nr:oligosaccharide flippase family protein [Zwartia sp.]MDO9023578.1 oligosaccharide flippase family protein [Zwartia sp.]
MGTKNIRNEMWLSAAILFARQIISASLSLVTLVLALYFIGPVEYGVFVSASSLISIFCAICNLGIGAYLLRSPSKPSSYTYDQAFTILLMTGMTAIVVGVFLLEQISAWVGVVDLKQLAFALLFSIPVVIVSRVPQCKIERQLDYALVAKVELLAIIFRFFLTLFCFIGDLGVWSLVYGWWGFHILTLLGFLYQGKYTPHLCWKIKLLKPMLVFGMKTWLARSIFNLRDLANPLIVAKILGTEAVTIVSIATNLCEVAAIGLGVSQRISGGVFGKFQKNKEKLSTAISEGTFLQVWIVGFFQSTIILIGLLLSKYLDSVWQSALLLLPYVSIYYLVLALIQLNISALYTHNKVGWIIFINIVYVFILMFLAYLLSKRYGINGYGFAVAASSFLLLVFLFANGLRSRADLSTYSVITASFFATLLFVLESSPWAILLISLLFIIKPIREEFKKIMHRIKFGWLKTNME